MGVRAAFIALQLAHVGRNRAKAARNYADPLSERIAMMQSRADWIDDVAAVAACAKR